jgi:branched-chain amino acid transport system permease protein
VGAGELTGQLLQLLLSGLAVGATYALVGLGIALVVQVTGVINFAQGEFVMLGALPYAMLAGAGVNRLLAAALAVAGTACVGALVNLAVIQPARRASTDRLILLTLGASTVLQGLTLVAVGTDPRFARPFTDGEPLRLGGANLPLQYLWVVGTTALAVAAVWWLLVHTRTGAAMRATAMDAEAARLVGVSPRRMSLAVFILAAAVGAVGGVVLAPLQAPDAQIGVALGLKGFTAAVAGGLDNPAGAVAGGLLLGLLEALAAGYLPSGYRDAVAYGLLVAVLLARPTGLLRSLPGVRG